MKKFLNEVIPYIVIILVVILARTYIATPVIVSGDSMVPTLENRQLLLLNKINYKLSNIKRYDIVVIKMDNKEIIKRVIGLPGETIEYYNNKLYIDGHEVADEFAAYTDDFTLKNICNCDKIPSDKYLVLGDNRKVSADSRIMGLIDKKNIEGSVGFSMWPIKTVN